MVRLHGRIEVVFWRDAMFDGTTMNLDGMLSKQGFIQMTVGIVLPPTGDGVLRLVAERSLSTHDWYKHLIVIPEGIILKRVKLPMDAVRANWKRLSEKHGLPDITLDD